MSSKIPFVFFKSLIQVNFNLFFLILRVFRFNLYMLYHKYRHISIGIKKIQQKV